MKHTLLFTFLFFLLAGCQEVIFTPKPRGYPRVHYPDKKFQTFEEEYCNFTFEYPQYGLIQQDKDFFEEEPVHSCWFDIFYPDFDSRIYCSYYPISKENTLEKLQADAFKMSDWHLKKATYKEETPFKKNNNVRGMLFEVEGPVASHLQFYLTDSLGEKHFLRGALYFNTHARPDSLAPVYDFVKQDVQKLFETFEWNE
ncbi:MAG: hypothetical protein NXI23_03935 [Bacteroidetes bacterium]|jgi:gliding motility-associated lipoprotein GldD|nr:hypothetical protein [Bacteroidota bacterium]MDF1863717.1 hypothetical protein [Saprospiraceae bacterium]